MSIKLVTLSLIVVIFGGAYGYPLHASCNIEWKFSRDCALVNKAIIAQIDKWKTKDNCKKGGEKCLYTLLSSSADEIKAKHTTPVAEYTDSLSFKFEKQSDKSCKVKGASSSDTWYAFLDYGTNYCNLHNLITGAGLDKSPNYSESTCNSICTQYTSADCEKY